MTARLRIVGVNDVYSLAALPKLASLIQQARSIDPPDRLLVTVAGDFLAPSLISSLDGGRAMAAAFDALGASHVTIGNHENDLPLDDLRARLSGLRATIVVSNAARLELPHVREDVVEVGGLKVGLLGLLDANPTLFHEPPFGGARFISSLEVAQREATRLRAEGCSAVIALTHQRLPADRLLAATRALDLILGGHEHEGYLELEHGTPLAKAPQNAASAVWAELTMEVGRPSAVSVRLVPVAGYPEDPAMRALVDRLLTPVLELEQRVLFRIPEGEVLSSVGSRQQETSLATKICSGLRDALHAEAALFNGGGIRGPAPHVREFSYADLRDELPFDNEVVVTRLPGAVLADAIRFSREKLQASGGFLQVDDRAKVTAAHELVALAGAPLDPARLYQVALVRELLLGMDGIEPLVAYVRAHPEMLPAKASGQEGKVALLRVWTAGA